MRIAKQFDHNSKIILRLGGILIGVLLLFDLVTFLLAEGFWFQGVNYGPVFVTRLLTQGLTGLIVFAVSLSVLWWNLTVAQQQVWNKPASDRDRPAFPGHMGLMRLLPLVLLLSFTVAASLTYYGQIAASHWRPQLSLRSANLPVPLKFDPQVLWGLLQGWQAQPWLPFLIAGLTIALLVYPRILLRSVAVPVSLGFVLVLSEHWDKLLLAFHHLPFNQTDPLFQTDIGFYIFTLPLWELIRFWLVGLVGLTFLLVSLVYLLSADSLSQGYFPGFSERQLRHLCGLGGWLMLIVAFSYWIDRYSLLYSPQGAAYGASYTSASIELPVYTGLSLLAIPIGLWLLGQSIGFGKRHRVGITGRKPKKLNDESFTSPYSILSRTVADPTNPSPQPSSASSLSATGSQTPIFQSLSLNRILLVISLYLLTILLLSVALPVLTQQFVVQPNELKLERSFIERTLAFTRQGFRLDDTDRETFDPSNGLTLDLLQENNLTIKNVRLWDKRPLLETNRQLQRIRLYYEFPDADVDRYTLPTEDGRTIQQQVLIAARELDYTAVPTAAQTWINQHLIYTHGYGFTVSPVNRVAEGGLPDYLIRGIETVPDPRLGNSIPIGKPRIYYGELTDTYVMTQTRVQELDYPSGSDNVYNTYAGRGGVNIGNLGRRLLYAKHLKDWRMPFTGNFTPQTKVLFRRNINARVKTIAPFLRYDTNPYLVVVDTGNKQWQHNYQPVSSDAEATEPDESHLYWIIDAYTTSDRYPYSDPLDNGFNYIRNSVKVVVDAYHGSVNFYIADLQDPIIQTWSKIFPGMFEPLTAMPAALQRHIRYPQDILQVQSNQLMTYHMTDPIVFYNREDQWRAPNEIYGSEQQVVEPYYLIMKLPVAESEEFILLRPFTPAQRSNLIAWLAARSDGKQYGRILLYIFPKQELVFGPEQVEARINQDPVISEQISLWNRQGSRVIQGNLLVIPVERSLLYVEPLYLVSEQTQLPTLVRVIVVYGSRIAMAESLEEALNAIFTASPTSEAPVILRTTEEAPAP